MTRSKQNPVRAAGLCEPGIRRGGTRCRAGGTSFVPPERLLTRFGSSRGSASDAVRLCRPGRRRALLRLPGGLSDQALVDRHVVLRHANSGEPLLETLAHTTAVERQDPAEHLDGLIHRVHDMPGHALVDHLGHRSHF